MIGPIKLRATFDEVSWPSDEEEPDEVGGWCDPCNPWGGLDAIPPDGLCGPEYSGWVEQNVDAYVAESLSDAVHFVVDFPGGVWDYRESESEMDYRTGVYRRVTLHVPAEHKERIFRWVGVIERIQNQRLRARLGY